MKAKKKNKPGAGRPKTPDQALKLRGSWRHKARKKAPPAQPKKAVKLRVTKANFSNDRLRRIMRTGLPGYDPWRDRGKCKVDYDAARAAIRFFHTQLEHVKGDLNRQPFKLANWQISIVANLFGWKRPDGTRRYRECWIFVPRKNGKTTLAAGLLLYLLFEDGEPMAELYGAASEYKQASQVYHHARSMVLRNESLNERCQIFKGQAKAIQLIEDFSTYAVISADSDSAEGFNTSGFVLDEVHKQKNRDLIESLQTSTGGRRQPLGIYLTTSDYDRPNSICNEMQDYAVQVRDGVRKNPYFLPAIFESGKDEDWTKKKTWQKANPNLGITPKLEYIEEACRRAQENPARENIFRRRHLNQRTEQDVRWIPLDLWDKCGGLIDAEELNGQPCWAGLDLASTSDITAFVLAFIGDDDLLRLLPFYWVPEETATQRDIKNRTTYQQWIDEGLIRTTPGNQTDYAFIRRDINEIAKRHDIQKIAVDRLFQGAQLGHELQQDGFKVFAHGQGFRSMPAPTAEFERRLRSGTLAHGDCPVLRWMAQNCSVELDAAGNMKPSKVKSTEKIDGIVAAIMALTLVMAREDTTCVYSSRGVLLL